MPELWLVDLQEAAGALEALERDMRLLSADDRQRTLRLRDPGERRQRRAAYIALRIVLARTAGRGVKTIRLLRPAGGKPRLAAAGATFSLSHTQGFALIAVGRRGAIGVDVESVRPIRMSARRRAEIAAAGQGLSPAPLAGQDDDGVFLRAWVRLEAFAKAEGRGVARVLADLGLRAVAGRKLALPGVEAAMLRQALASGVKVVDVMLPPGLFGALALPRGVRSPRLQRFPTGIAAIRDLLTPRR
jgi:4'-phosphopantetheinyl transferase